MNRGDKNTRRGFLKKSVVLTEGAMAGIHQFSLGG
jgi:hypothetical protein